MASTSVEIDSARPRKKRKRRKIFICYRRADGAEIAGRLYDWLCRRFDKRCVIKDKYSIPPGVDFADFIADVIPTCTVVLVVIGPNWMGGGRGARRGAQRSQRTQRAERQTDDYVRLEVECALAQGIRIIPVLVGDARLPAPAKLPKDLRPITRLHSVQLRSDPDFPADFDRLAAHL